MSGPKIERYRGDTAPIRITVRDEDGTIIPLTTETLTLSVATTENPTVAADVFTASGNITDGPNGKVSFPIPGTADAGNYFYDIQLTNTDSTIETIAKNDYIVIQDITK